MRRGAGVGGAAGHMRRPFRLFFMLAAGHLVATVAALVYSFGAGMSRFDTGEPASSTEIVLGHLTTVLSFPVLPVIARPAFDFPGLWGYVPFALNSALWAGAMMVVLRWTTEVRRRSGSPVLVAIVVGLPATLIAAACLLRLYAGEVDDTTFVLNGVHDINGPGGGGAADQRTLTAIAIASGTLAVLCGLRIYRALGTRRTNSLGRLH